MNTYDTYGSTHVVMKKTVGKTNAVPCPLRVDQLATSWATSVIGMLLNWVNTPCFDVLFKEEC